MGRDLKQFTIVGIGASAGGLAAFEAFFSGFPLDSDPGMAFILVQHLAPEHKSILTELLGRYTHMPVSEVVDGMVVKPNCVYVIPPNREMAFSQGALQLFEPTEAHGRRLPVDFLFRSLAAELHEKAIGIILSGTGSDGVLGVRAIKGEGGMVIAQKGDTTEYDGMPRSAMATGLVDYELAPAEMLQQILDFVNSPVLQAVSISEPNPAADIVLKKICILLHAKTGYDFSQYKTSTIYRRTERRMVVRKLSDLNDYLKLLHRNPVEVQDLFQDLLIGVTHFFRDPEAFTVLEEQVIPKIFAEKPVGSTVRAWVAGCSTGEEAYSVAILLQEHMEKLKKNYKIQVFATDIDPRALASARLGIYPSNITGDLTQERLAKCFTLEPDGNSYRIHGAIRDMLVFSAQDLIKDPPFSRLDLICCRNLLIYISAALQKKIIPLFHHSLSAKGWLFLGSSESIGECTDMFTTQDRKQKIFRRKEEFPLAKVTPVLQSLPQLTGLHGQSFQYSRYASQPMKPPFRELTEQALLQHLDQVAALVNAQGDVLYIHGRSGLYLEPSPGESGVSSILNMARDGLRMPLSTALFKSIGNKSIVDVPGIQVNANGLLVQVDLTVRPTTDPLLFLVVLKKGAALPVLEPPTAGIGSAVVDDAGSFSADDVLALKRELLAKEDYLISSNEELETANEELRSTNEEMQSVNEELQSSNEELETSKEELQSVNEELATVNAELQNKVLDLSRTSNDMGNLLAGTGIATVFVDHDLRILRFTPTATQIINLIQSDVGRPVAHIASNLVGHSGLVDEVTAVLDTLVPRKCEVQTIKGDWYSMSIMPYRTLDNVIEGAVLTFVDISETRKVQEALGEAQVILQAAMDNSQAGIAIADAPSGKLRYVNDPGLAIRGGDRTQLVDDVGVDQYVSRWQLFDLDGKPMETDEVPLARAVLFGESCRRELTLCRAPGDDRHIVATAAAIRNLAGKVTAGVVVFIDLTDSKTRGG